MNHKVTLVLFAALFVLAMGTEQAWAQHASLEVTLNVDWNGLDIFDIQARVSIHDDQNNPIGDQETFEDVPLIPNEGQNTVWTVTMLDIDEDGYQYIIEWDMGNYQWLAPPPLSGVIIWTNPVVERETECFEE